MSFLIPWSPPVPAARIALDDPPAPLHVLIFADAFGPTQQISFELALKRSREQGAVGLRLIDDAALTELRQRAGLTALYGFLRRQFEETAPCCVILSRYVGEDHALIFALAREWGVPVICHLDDNLLDPPATLGLDLWAGLLKPGQVQALSEIIAQADLVYASTSPLGAQLTRLVKPRRLVSGRIYVGGDPNAQPGPLLEGLQPKQPGEIRIGYMGSRSHVSDLEMIRPSLLAVLEAFPQASFHLFGSIAEAPATRVFGTSVTAVRRVRGTYADFRLALNSMEWDIGLAPLRPLDFNACKAPTKCIEYFEAGCAAIASAGVVYDPLAARGAVLAVQPHEWRDALSSLVAEPRRRTELVQAGRELLRTEFNWTRLERQVLDVLAIACGKAPMPGGNGVV